MILRRIHPLSGTFPEFLYIIYKGIFVHIYLYMMKNLIRKILREDDFDWVRGVKPKTNYEDIPEYTKDLDKKLIQDPKEVKIGDLLMKYNGHVVYRVEDIEDWEVNGVSDMLGTKLKREVTYVVRNVVNNRLSRIDSHKRVGVSYPKRIPVYRKNNIYKLIPKIRESEDFEWMNTSIGGRELRNLILDNDVTTIPFKEVGGDLDLWGTPIKTLGNLQSVGGDLTLRDTPISKKYSEEEIREQVDVEGNIYI